VNASVAIPPMSLEKLDALVQRLPADLRAEVKWDGPTLRNAVHRLLHEPVSEPLVTEVCRAVIQQFIRLMDALKLALPWATLKDEMRSSEADIVKLRACLAPTGTADIGEWALRAADAAMAAILERFGSDVEKATAELDSSKVAQEIEAQPLHGLRSRVLVAAILEAGSRPELATRVGELAGLAYLDVVRFIDLLKLAQVAVEPFGPESDAQRSERTLRYAQGARAALDSEAVEALKAGRLNALR
jgi:hypothetical protein